MVEAAVVVVAAVAAFAVAAVDREQVPGKAHTCIEVFAGQGSSSIATYKHMARTAKGQPLVTPRLCSQIELCGLSVKTLSLGFQKQEVSGVFAVVVVAAVAAFAVVAVEREQVPRKAHMCIVVFAGQGSSSNATNKHMARTAKGQPLVTPRLCSHMELSSLPVEMPSLGFQMQEVCGVFAVTLHWDLQMATSL